MAAPTVNAMRDAIAATLVPIPDTQISAYALTNPTPPTLQVLAGETPYDETFGRGMDMHNFKIQAIAGLTSDIGAQKLHGRYVDATGTHSVRAAIAADPTLGGVVKHAQVIGAGEEVTYAPERGAYVGREFAVEVLAAGV